MDSSGCNGKEIFFIAKEEQVHSQWKGENEVKMKLL
jgi:hypothetical protein